jgi:glycogen synthase
LEKKIAFITYETPFAPGGGIAAVMAHLPIFLQDTSRIPTYVISPFHVNIPKTTELETRMVTLETIRIPFDDELVVLDIKLLREEIRWIFLKPQSNTLLDPPFFAGMRHPYDVDTTEGQSILLRDSLFFGKAASIALPAISPNSSWTILMQDWEAATTSLAIHAQTHKNFTFSTFLTLHNSYDCGLREQDFVKTGLDPDKFIGDTVLECSLTLIDDPVFTVSEQFAVDLSSEILQTKIMIPHITSKLSNRIKGVNNGVFVKNSIPKSVYKPAQDGNYSPIHKWKINNRELAFAAMDKISPSEDTPIWGDLKKFDRQDAPWIVMAGRDDSRQKGYEIACMAIDQFLKTNDRARFIFFPIPGDEGLPGIEYINDLAKKHSKQVLGFPFLFREGFFAILQGATFGIMPSYYEPFGMANEYYLNGVGCIGRATGGIIQQIIPNRQVGSFSPAVEQRAVRWHNPNSQPTGLLFREPDGLPSALDDWRQINTAEYEISSNKSNRLLQRRKLATIRHMADELTQCLEDATQIYLNDQDKYYRMLINGVSYIMENFSWELTAKIYYRLIIDQPN